MVNVPLMAPMVQCVRIECEGAFTEPAWPTLPWRSYDRPAYVPSKDLVRRAVPTLVLH
jgi:hypothetical protein